MTRQRLLDPASLVRTNWRTVLAAGLDRLPELRTAVSVTEPLRGLVLAGSLRLPETVVLAADMNDPYCGVILGTPAGNGGDGGNGGNGGSGGQNGFSVSAASLVASDPTATPVR